MMDTQQVRTLLTDVADGNRSVDEAVAALRMAPFEDLGYAKLDHHRGLRQGVPEVVFGARYLVSPPRQSARPTR